MPILYGNPNTRHKYEAFQIIEQSGHEPLKEAIACALGLRQTRETMEIEVRSITDVSERLKAIGAVSMIIDAEGKAWIKVAEFVYAKPKQQIEHSGGLTLEKLLDGSWEEERKLGLIEAQ